MTIKQKTTIPCHIGFCLAMVMCAQFKTISLFADESNDTAIAAIALLKRECISCHGPDKQEGSLRLDSMEMLEAGGDNGPLIPSRLLERMVHQDDELVMPPQRRLSESSIAIIKSWIDSGAKWPAESVSENSDRTPNIELGNAWVDQANPIRKLFAGQRLDLWSLRPIVRPDAPDVLDKTWCRNNIDRFVLSQWESQGLVPGPVASDQVLARRTSLDITGLPPTFDSLQALVHETAPDKYEQWIDQLLQSPDMGVHWARMWLDVVRYSDSNGFDWDELRPNAWRYRDYVVRSFNRDVPFDRFVSQQLAGDELNSGPPRNSDEQDNLIATGYLRMGPQDNAAKLFNEQDRARAELMSDLTETTASAFLGLTMSCCRCHDHKTDPLSHADHYRFRAFFAACHYADEVSIDLEEDQIAIKKHNSRRQSAIKKSRDAIANIKKAVQKRQPEKVSADELKKIMTESETEEVEKNEQRIATLTKELLPITRGLLMHDKPESVQTIHVLVGGDHRSPKDPVEPGFPSVLFPNTPRLLAPSHGKSTGRRLTLAQWMSSPDNPWTARVIVNRLWQNYFGTGIVATPSDFGVTGALPTHPELLDYLAAELIDSGWSLKHMHRLIVNSNTYRQATRATEPAFDDSRPGRASLRRAMRRMSAEQMRDSILHASGLLQERAGGPPIWPELDEATLAANPAVLDDNETKTKGWYPSPDHEQTVRSLYLVQKRTIRIPWMETFDLPENAISCGRRECSIVAPQSLAKMNGNLSLQAAKAIERRIEEDDSAKDSKVAQAFRTILLRDATPMELTACEDYLIKHSLGELCLVLLNTNEFEFIE